MLRRLASLLCLTALAPPLLAQNLTWTPRNDLNANLPASIQVFEGIDSSIPLKAWYVLADPTDTTWVARALLSDEAGGTETVSSFAADENALVAINTGYFGGGQSFSLVADGGQVVSNNIKALNRPNDGGTFFPTRSAFAILEDSTLDVAWIYDVGGTPYFYPNPSPNARNDPQPEPTATFPDGGQPWPLLTAVGGGPVVVENGQARITWEEEVFFGSGIGEVSARQPRTALGYTAEGQLLLVVVDGRQFESAGASLTELANILISLGAVEALNLDGGGSSTLVADQTLVNRPQGGTTERSVASALVLAPKPDDAGPTEESFFDTGDACCYTETANWFESANTPFYGGTQARLNEVGTGDDTATFLLNDITAGTYEVSAWWVASFNRATDTPYTIYQQGTGTTVRVDQSDAGTLNQWNPLGTFALAPGDSIVVSDDASGGTGTFVCVDALRLVPVIDTAADPLPARPARHTLTLYPNPTTGPVTLAYPETPGTLARGEVIDLLGRVVHRFEGRGMQTDLSLAHLPTGLYFVRLHTAEGLRQRSVVVH